MPELGIGSMHYSTGDEGRPNCPQCYGNSDVKLVGLLNLKQNGANKVQGVHECSRCRRIFSTEERQGCISSLVSEAECQAGVEDVSFCALGSGEVKVDTTNIEMTVDSNRDSLYEVKNQLSVLTSLVTQLQTENKELLEKLLKDPLQGMRRAVNDFNLE